MSAMAKAAPKPTAKPTSSDDQERLSGWQQRALDRSLVEAKRRALDKSNGFVKAAMALLDETGTLNFTVQDVVDRSKLSLRSFYQTFASKDDLLLALFEEYVATAADWQRDRMAKHDDPVDQIRDFLTSLWVGKLSPDVVRALAVYNMTLSSTRPADLAHALEPQLLVLLEAVERGIASGQVRDDIGSRRLAEILLHTGNAAVQTTILHTGSE
jgi:AcrR family transcriptional regulator